MLEATDVKEIVRLLDLSDEMMISLLRVAAKALEIGADPVKVAKVLRNTANKLEAK